MKAILFAFLLTVAAFGQGHQGMTINVGQTYSAGAQDAY